MSATASVAATRDVLTYLSHYRGRLFVLRIEDDLLGAPLLPMLIKDIVLLQRMGIRTVLVPGARQAIDAALGSAAGGLPVRPAAPVGIGERRITGEADMAAVMRGSASVVNELLALLTESGARAVVGNWVRARTAGVVDGVDYQRTGRVERIDADLLRALLDTGAIPIISNIGWNAVGKAYNISSLELVVAVARALQAAKVYFWWGPKRVSPPSPVPESSWRRGPTGTTPASTTAPPNGCWSVVESSSAPPPVPWSAPRSAPAPEAWTGCTSWTAAATAS